ncbi:hypothetical protein CJ195_26905 [Bacillus sp. UMB0899]|nr:hypothetical protein CJ195_26905 [Bacillus sp. UMB0899]
METLLEQIYWLWVPLALLPIWLRIAIFTFIVIILMRPVLFHIAPRLIEWISILLHKAVHYLSYPVMVLFHKFLSKRRNQGNYIIPSWLEGIEELFALLLKTFSKTEMLSKKRTRNKAKWKRTFRLVGIALAILLPLAIVNNPTSSYSQTWDQFDRWMTEEKVQNDLGFDIKDYQGTLLAKVEEVSSKVNTKEYILTDQYKSVGGNVRANPSLDGQIVEDIFQDETVTYMDEQKIDNRGITWLKIETQSGKTGWISSKIVEEK